MDLIAVARRAFLASKRNNLLPGTVAFDIAITVLPAQIFIHRSFHALNTVMLKIRESDDVTKHGPVRVDATGVVFEINSPQIAGTQSFAWRIRQRFRYLPLDHDVAALAGQFFWEPLGRDHAVRAQMIH